MKTNVNLFIAAVCVLGGVGCAMEPPTADDVAPYEAELRPPTGVLVARWMPAWQTLMGEPANHLSRTSAFEPDDWRDENCRFEAELEYLDDSGQVRVAREPFGDPSGYANLLRTITGARHVVEDYYESPPPAYVDTIGVWGVLQHSNYEVTIYMGDGQTPHSPMSPPAGVSGTPVRIYALGCTMDESSPAGPSAP